MTPGDTICVVEKTELCLWQILSIPLHFAGGAPQSRKPHPSRRVWLARLRSSRLGRCMLPYIRDQILELVNESLLVAVL